MLIRNYEERCKKKSRKKVALLQFLRDEIWTSAPVASELLSLSPSATYKTLASFERAGYLVSDRIRDLGIRVWGISNKGLFEAFDDVAAIPLRRAFEPSKLKPLTVNHELNLQLARLRAEKNGWRNWQLGKHMASAIQKRPDAIATDPEGKTVFVELEINEKSRHRIEKIFSIYLQKIKHGELDYVAYVCPTKIFADRLKKVFDSINQIPVAGTRVNILDKHRSKFPVYDLDSSWPPYSSQNVNK